MVNTYNLPPPFLKFGMMAFRMLLRKVRTVLSFSEGVSRVITSKKLKRLKDNTPQLAERKPPTDCFSAFILNIPVSWVRVAVAVWRFSNFTVDCSAEAEGVACVPVVKLTSKPTSRIMCKIYFLMMLDFKDEKSMGHGARSMEHGALIAAYCPLITVF
jgi:hypothetical protein